MSKHERKEKIISGKYPQEMNPLNKESEDLFKIAFRNYLNLVGIADKKAGLLIQVNSILASVIIGIVAKKIQDIHLLVIPAKPFGINTTLVMPGYFRTNFLNDSSLRTPQHEMDQYKNVRKNQNAPQQQIADNQPGDPDKAADVLIEVASMQTPPVHLFLGSDAYAIAEQKIALVQQEMQQHKALITSTDFKSVVA